MVFEVMLDLLCCQCCYLQMQNVGAGGAKVIAAVGCQVLCHE